MGTILDDLGIYNLTPTELGGTLSPDFDTYKFSPSAGTWGGSNYLRFPDSNAWTLSRTFTIEFWVYFDPSYSSTVFLMEHSQSGVSSGGFRIAANYSGGNYRIAAAFWVNGSSNPDSVNTSYVMSRGAWHHVALIRNNTGAIYCNIDGTLRASDSGTDVAMANLSTNFWLGCDRDQANVFRGYLDEVRFSTIARYPINSSITVPTAPFSTDANTTLLMHFNENRYVIEGTLTQACRVFIIDETGGTIEHDDTHSAGDYSIQVGDDNKKLIVARKSDDGQSIAYGNITPATI